METVLTCKRCVKVYCIKSLESMSVGEDDGISDQGIDPLYVFWVSNGLNLCLLKWIFGPTVSANPGSSAQT